MRLRERCDEDVTFELGTKIRKCSGLRKAESAYFLLQNRHPCLNWECLQKTRVCAFSYLYYSWEITLVNPNRPGNLLFWAIVKSIEIYGKNGSFAASFLCSYYSKSSLWFSECVVYKWQHVAKCCFHPCGYFFVIVRSSVIHENPFTCGSIIAVLKSKIFCR